MSYTPFQAPLLSGLFGDDEIAPLFSVESEIAAMLRFEAELAQAQAHHDVIPAEAGEAIASAIATFEPDLAALKAATARDGVVVPALIRQLRDHVGEPHAAHCHFGATSQDVVDTSFMIRLRDVVSLWEARLGQICDTLDALVRAEGENTLMARTRMQPALPIPASHRIASWRDPLTGQRTALSGASDGWLRLQLGGPVGTNAKIGSKAPAVSAVMAAALGLNAPERAWHTDRRAIVQIADWSATTTGLLGKIGIDICLMAQPELGEITLTETGGSSSMPHKHNPVLAESLQTLARFTGTINAGMKQVLLHEQERSGAAWSLEWMLLPQLCVATGAATRNALTLLKAVKTIGKAE